MPKVKESLRSGFLIFSPPASLKTLRTQRKNIISLDRINRMFRMHSHAGAWERVKTTGFRVKHGMTKKTVCNSKFIIQNSKLFLIPDP